MTALNKQALNPAELESALLELKRISEQPAVSTHYASVLRKHIANLNCALEAAEKRIAELEARDINIKRQAQALFEAIANPNDCYIPAYVRCLREALNGNSTGIGVKEE